MIIAAMGQQTLGLKDIGRVCFISCIISPDSHYTIVHKLVYGRCCYVHRKHYLPQMVSLHAVLQLLQSISLHLT